MTGWNKEQCFFLLYGTGGNGKTTFVETNLQVMGDYGAQIKTEVLMESSQYEQKDYHLAELCGKRFVAACEPNMRHKLASNLLKQASGGEKIQGVGHLKDRSVLIPSLKSGFRPTIARRSMIPATPCGGGFIRSRSRRNLKKGNWRRRTMLVHSSTKRSKKTLERNYQGFCNGPSKGVWNGDELVSIHQKR